MLQNCINCKKRNHKYNNQNTYFYNSIVPYLIFCLLSHFLLQLFYFSLNSVIKSTPKSSTSLNFSSKLCTFLQVHLSPQLHILFLIFYLFVHNSFFCILLILFDSCFYYLQFFFNFLISVKSFEGIDSARAVLYMIQMPFNSLFF